MTQRRRGQKKQRKSNLVFLVFCLVIILLVLGLMAFAVLFSEIGLVDVLPDSVAPSVSTPAAEDTAASTPPTEETTPSATEPTTEPTEPPITLVSKASVAATGDILMHMPCIRGGQLSDGSYDFSHYFRYIMDYVQQADYAVANLETTLCGTDNGYDYSGYPAFNCPDGIVPSLRDAGFDMMLTANNHCYDTRTKGFHRTQQVLTEAGLEYIGTVSSETDAQYKLVDINGIRLGMVCYTYETNSDPAVVAPNGITMTQADSKLINSFHVQDLPGFYARIEDQIQDMEAEGAEGIVLFIHWGEEYQLQENQTQNAIAQKMCDLGVDVIVGGHPHVIQPMELLTSGVDDSHKTLCLYSTGNALSNQRRAAMRLDTGHTEDGVLFTFSFAKYSDGTVRVEQAELMPTWVNKYRSSATGKDVYEIYPLDLQIEDWKTQMDMTESTEQMPVPPGSVPWPL